MQKRNINRLILLSLTGLMAVAAPVRGAGDAPRRPNFIFIYTDDQRWDALSCVQQEQGDKGRFPWLQTPNMDRIAREGVRFRNAFVVNSLCSPSRASFLTGTYGHVNGVRGNRVPFPVDNVTHASLLRQAGYVTGFFGKWHMEKQSGQRPGFDYSASFIGQGSYFDCPFEINGKKTATRGWVDDVSTDYATQFIRDHKDKPFALVLGFKTCHAPFTPPPRHANTYGDAKARTVPNLGVRAIYRQNAAGRGEQKVTAGNAVDTNLGMFRGITAVDENVGKLLKLLDELKLADDTMVVFSSDNGYYLGEHGLGDKRSAYEESLRIPILVRYPRLGNAGKLVDQMALNIDLAPTFLDYAGVAVPAAMQGRSWRPLLEGKAEGWRQSFFYCYFLEPQFDDPMVAAVRTETAKLIQYPGHPEWTEVFDLKADPYELKNLVNAPEAEALKKQLLAEYQKQSEAIGLSVDKYAHEASQPKTKQPKKKKKS